jgi:hypothetical protein
MRPLEGLECTRTHDPSDNMAADACRALPRPSVEPSAGSREESIYINLSAKRRADRPSRRNVTVLMLIARDMWSGIGAGHMVGPAWTEEDASEGTRPSTRTCQLT